MITLMLAGDSLHKAGAGGRRRREISKLSYSWKYWRKLNLAVESIIAIARILVDLNLALRYGIVIRILYVSRKFGGF